MVVLNVQTVNIPEIHPTKTGWGPTPKNQQTLRKHPSATPHPCDSIEKINKKRTQHMYAQMQRVGCPNSPERRKHV